MAKTAKALWMQENITPLMDGKGEWQMKGDEFDLGLTGFVICQFDPAKDDECEVCEKDEVQLYYRRTCYESDEGDYYCLDCVKNEHEQNLKDLEGWADYAEKLGVA